MSTFANIALVFLHLATLLCATHSRKPTVLPEAEADRTFGNGGDAPHNSVVFLEFLSKLQTKLNNHRDYSHKGIRLRSKGLLEAVGGVTGNNIGEATAATATPVHLRALLQTDYGMNDERTHPVDGENIHFTTQAKHFVYMWCIYAWAWLAWPMHAWYDAWDTELPRKATHSSYNTRIYTLWLHVY